MRNNMSRGVLGWNRAGLFAAASVSASLLLAACSSDGGDDAELRDDTGGLADRQIIQAVSSLGGTPIAGVQIQLDDGEWITTDANGEASFPAVDRAFTVSARQTTGGNPSAFSDVWRLVEQTDNPLVLAVDGSAAPVLSALVSGQVTGRRGGNDSVIHVFAITGRGDMGSVVALDSYGFELPIFLEGHRAAQGPRKLTLAALETNAAATRALAFGTAEVQISDGDAITADLALAPIAEAQVSGVVALPDRLAADLHPQARLIFDGFDDAATDPAAAPSLRLFQSTHTAPVLFPGAYALDLPVIAGARVEVGFSLVEARGGFTPGTSSVARQVELPAQDVAFQLPPVLQQREPAAGAQVPTSAVFRWDPVADSAEGEGKYVFRATCAAGLYGAPLYLRMIETTATEVTLPAVDGVSLSGMICHWQVAWLNVPAARALAAGVLADDARVSWSAQRLVTLR